LSDTNVLRNLRAVTFGIPVFLTTSWSLILGDEGVNASSIWRPLLRLFVNDTLDIVPPNET
jgi:hypothetical protein